MSQFGHEVYGQFEALMAVDGEAPFINYRTNGYLFLGEGARDSGILESNWRVQRAEGADVELLDRAALKTRFPSLFTGDVDLAAFSPQDAFIEEGPPAAAEPAEPDEPEEPDGGEDGGGPPADDAPAEPAPETTAQPGPPSEIARLDVRPLDASAEADAERHSAAQRR